MYYDENYDEDAPSPLRVFTLASQEDIAPAFRALYPTDLVARYDAGERDFPGINLLRAELELIVGQQIRERGPTPVEPYECDLWENRHSLEATFDFEWDSDGRFVPIELEDLPEERDLENAKLSGVNLSSAYLYPVNLSGADLEGADLRKAKLIDVKLRGANLSRADMRDAMLLDVDLKGANLYMARMDRARLPGAVRNANLKRAKLKKASLADADLRGACLDYAHFDRTWLSGASLKGTDLKKCKLPNVLVDRLSISRHQVSDLLNSLGVELT